MKSVQVMFDEKLLAELDQTEEVREKGRSTVLRQLTSEFLRRSRGRQIDAQYERAYEGVTEPLGDGFEGWVPSRPKSTQLGTLSTGKARSASIVR